MKTVQGLAMLSVLVALAQHSEGNSLRDELDSKLRSSVAVDDDEDDVCYQIKQQTIRTDFSECNTPEGEGATIANQNGDECSQYMAADLTYNEQRTKCQEDQGCQWYAPPGWPRENHRCQANACYRINNNRCTIQHTGGRCVWWSKEDNLKFFGRNYPGCYKSPCQHPIKNNKRGCKSSNKLVPYKYWGLENEEDYAEESPYSCVWCTGGWGCQNAKMESLAQCWNIGEKAGCSSCKTNLGVDCNSNCAQECCDSPYCNCVKDSSRSTDNALDINTGGDS